MIAFKSGRFKVYYRGNGHGYSRVFVKAFYNAQEQGHLPVNTLQGAQGTARSMAKLEVCSCSFLKSNISIKLKFTCRKCNQIFPV